MSVRTRPRACPDCAARSWLIGRLAGHLDAARGRIEQALALEDDELVAAVAGNDKPRVWREFESLDVAEVRSRALAARLEMICRCDRGYPPALAELAAPPAVLYVAGGLERLLELSARDPVAIVGSRHPTPYGTDVARSLGRSLACAGLTVVSGMAHGIDSAAHSGALDGGEPTLAVLPGSAHRPYPSGQRPLYRRIVSSGVAVSELGPDTSVRRWMFLARNRIIAGLAAIAIVVEATERSGALVTARLAREIGRPVGAVPGRIVTPQAVGPNDLLAGGACVVRGAQDVLDHLFGAGARLAGAAGRRQAPAELRPLLAAIAEGHDTAAALARAGYRAEDGLAALAALELDGFVRRGAGGRFSIVP